MKQAIVTGEFDGKRLDKALELLHPELGLRQRRRLWESGWVKVDGFARDKNYKVRQGQRLEVERYACELPECSGVRLVADQGGFGALYKPSGIHSAAIEGKPTPSVESMLGEFWPDEKTRLLNRLDEPTTGILLVALNPKAETIYRTHDAANIMKRYLALVQGRVERGETLRNLLDTDNRKTTRVLDELAPSFLRWTRIEPAVYLPERDATLVRAFIHRGARHQIRAHLAHFGHPIIGDTVYGAGEPGGLYLHHYKIEFPGFVAECDPEWPDVEPPTGGG